TSQYSKRFPWYFNGIFLQVLKIQFQVLALICFEMAAFIFNFLDTAQLIFFVPFYKLVMEVL
ncbi:hypothetical protein ACVZYT_004408, partial [Yersinia enterocolitica]|nr:hypothetical protein [Yersinia enterocolitica]